MENNNKFRENVAVYNKMLPKSMALRSSKVNEEENTTEKGTCIEI